MPPLASIARSPVNIEWKDGTPKRWLRSRTRANDVAGESPACRFLSSSLSFAGWAHVASHEDAVYAGSMPAERSSTRKRSLVKALTYRVVIVCLDFLAIYIFTHKIEVALGFMIVSNIYTTIGYFVHERIWARIRWGKEEPSAG
jgi:uncharacterized membrane protein